MTTHLNDSFFYLLLAFNVSVISLFILSKLRKLQKEMLILRSDMYLERALGKKFKWAAYPLTVSRRTIGVCLGCSGRVKGK